MKLRRMMLERTKKCASFLDHPVYHLLLLFTVSTLYVCITLI